MKRLNLKRSLISTNKSNELNRLNKPLTHEDLVTHFLLSYSRIKDQAIDQVLTESSSKVICY